VLHTFFLVARTVLSVMVARLDGRIVRDLVSAVSVRHAQSQGLGQRQRLHPWTRLVVRPCDTEHIHQLYGKPTHAEAHRPLQIRFLERKLALAFRTNLTRYIHDLYL
jgi:ATP-binding cassette subfamily D (ALD) long-chain fatty acid import protein